MQNLATTINLALQNGETEIVIEKGLYSVSRAFVLVENKEGITLDFSGSEVTCEGCFLTVRSSQNVLVRNLSCVCTSKNEFAARTAQSQVTFENCKFVCDCGGIMTGSEGDITVRNCSFGPSAGNGILVAGNVTAEVFGNNFEELSGEAVTVVDDRLGTVSLRENSFKRCAYGVVSQGKNGIRMNNNYFLTYYPALVVKGSPYRKDEDGAFRVEAEYNLFDECATDGGLATVQIAGVKEKGYVHKEIRICNNIFSQKKRPVLDADGVEVLLFRDNRVKTDDESTVVNSVINGIRT